MTAPVATVLAPPSAPRSAFLDRIVALVELGVHPVFMVSDAQAIVLRHLGWDGRALRADQVVVDEGR